METFSVCCKKCRDIFRNNFGIKLYLTRGAKSSSIYMCLKPSHQRLFSVSGFQGISDIKYADFARCPHRAIYLARSLSSLGYMPSVCFGLLTPTTKRNAWDDRWKKSSSGVFIHAWIEVLSIYVDPSLFQFGYKGIIFSRPENSMYEKLGYIDIDTGMYLPNSMGSFLDWSTYRVDDELPVIKVKI